MRSIDLYNAVCAVDDDILERSEITAGGRKKSDWLKWGMMAACFGLILTAALMLPSILKGQSSVTLPPAPNMPEPWISSEDEPSNTEQLNWQTIEEICGEENQDASATTALYIPTYVAYQGAFYRMVGESRVGQSGAIFFNSNSKIPDTNSLEQIRYAIKTENVIYNPKAWPNPTYEYTVYLVENHMDCIALLINGYFTIYQKQFDVTFELNGITYGIVYETVDSDHCTLGETLLSNNSFTVYEAVFYLGEPNEHTAYVVDLLPKLKTDGYSLFLEDGANARWVAEPIERLTEEKLFPDKGGSPTEYPDTIIVPGFNLDEPNEPDTP